MQRPLSAVFLLFFILLWVKAEAQVFVTHAQSGYDSSFAAKVEIQNVLKYQDQKIYFLENNKSEWYVETNNKNIQWINSQFGEHKIKVDNNHIILMGHNTGACLQHTYIDILKNNSIDLPLNVHVPLRATVTTASNVTFSEEIKNLSKEEKLERILFYFNRHQSYYQRDLPKGALLGKKWSKIKIAYHLNGEFVGGAKKPEVILWAWEESKTMNQFFKFLK